MNRPIKVLLAGVGSLNNYGCEAIVRGTAAMFQDEWPECTLIVATKTPADDAVRFRDCGNVQFVQEGLRFTPKRLWKGFLRRIGIGAGVPVRMNSLLYRDKQIFLSCGGDNFCEAPDGSLYNILQDLMMLGSNAAEAGLLYSLWGASVGPFSKKDTERKIAEHLQAAQLLCLRERIAFDYVSSLPLDNNHILQVADPAYYMEVQPTAAIPRQPGEQLIGVNISPLACSPADFTAFNTLLAQHKNIRLLCIPHVISTQGDAQDDVSFMESFRAQSPYASRIDILPAGLGATATKGYIAQCDLLIAARMHACVAGCSAGTPTLFLTYSSKGVGMAEYVYGHRKWVLSTRNLTGQDLVAKTESMLSEIAALHAYLKANNTRFKSDAIRALHHLKQTYTGKKQPVAMPALSHVH
ncbi:Polysaccharide pyruvyl transferase family protein WcaK [Chitinophaga costaii]|uniref:Polysaccharide pyruvyl transferase family protein WcaK n=1 Tax=Chitinophaga costaii TaxID=1335309 RepID=A0A1C3ZA88_9BACT|nr:polysaccharide pyruvyl transferase family protein [Chitinophaga costaii]PUZ30291.1 polysaccharide pyruvyl transferase family protein [Chitinophaga costaii]SCB79294.1 Polysaccharide pyruvyl transferase family protein WcaK [Chitinophaga costaii]